MSIAHGDHDPVQAAVREILSYGNDGSFIINRVDHYLETFCGNHNQSHKLDAETIKDIKDRLKEGLFNSHLPPPVGDKEGDSLDRVALFYAQISQAALLQAREEGMIDCLLACLLAFSAGTLLAKALTTRLHLRRLLFFPYSVFRYV